MRHTAVRSAPAATESTYEFVARKMREEREQRNAERKALVADLIVKRHGPAKSAADDSSSSPAEQERASQPNKPVDSSAQAPPLGPVSEVHGGVSSKEDSHVSLVPSQKRDSSSTRRKCALQTVTVDEAMIAAAVTAAKSLPPRMREVLKHWQREIREISVLTGLSISSVKVYRYNICGKLGIRDFDDAARATVIIAVREKLFTETH